MHNILVDDNDLKVPIQKAVLSWTFLNKCQKFHINITPNRKVTKSLLVAGILTTSKYPREEICSCGNCSSSDCAFHYLLMGRVLRCKCQCHTSNSSSDCTVFLHNLSNAQFKLNQAHHKNI